MFRIICKGLFGDAFEYIETVYDISRGAIRMRIPEAPHKGKCPVCKNILKEKTYYCSNCGKALIWEEMLINK